MDIPKVQSTDLAGKLKAYAGAAAAVREGIATHAQKHRAAMHEARKAAAAKARLTQGH